MAIHLNIDAASKSPAPSYAGWMELFRYELIREGGPFFRSSVASAFERYSAVSVFAKPSHQSMEIYRRTLSGKVTGLMVLDDVGKSNTFVRIVMSDVIVTLQTIREEGFSFEIKMNDYEIKTLPKPPNRGPRRR